MNQAAERLLLLAERLLAGEIEVAKFCEEYETAFNFEVDKKRIADLDKFSQLFDVVVWYSPFPEERKLIPHYVDEEAVLRATQEMMRAVKQKPGSENN